MEQDLVISRASVEGGRWDMDGALKRVGAELIALLPGAPWRGHEKLLWSHPGEEKDELDR